MKKPFFLLVLTLCSFVFIKAQQPYAAYYDNGQKKVQGNRDGKVKLGEWTYYYDNGGVMRNGVYQEGVPVGEWTEYYRSGQEKSVVTYVKKGEESFRNGEWIEYHKNGAQKITGTYRLGRKAGVWKEYNTLGIEIRKQSY